MQSPPASAPSTTLPCSHRHAFHGGNRQAERGARRVLWITAAAMVLEIAAGWWFNSMALLADGWHMSSHALAIGLTAFAYAAARRYAADARFAFGTWKIEVLAGFTSAILLLGVAALMVAGSIERLLAPQAIHYREALLVAVAGLAVNLVCAFILGGHGHGHDHGHGAHDGHGHGQAEGAHHDHDHDHGHAHAHGHGQAHAAHAAQGHHAHHGQDLNLRSAYLHVVADAATSVLAIVALAGGWLYGWAWLDPVMGLVGAVLVAVWARGLLMDTGKALLDREMDDALVQRLRAAVQVGADRITDLHAWRVGRSAWACVLTVRTPDAALDAQQVRERLRGQPEIVHATIEVQHLRVDEG